MRRQTVSRLQINICLAANRQRAASIERKMKITRLTLEKTGKSL